MDIIRQGKPTDVNADQVWEGECRNCGSLISAKRYEIENNIRYDQRDDTHFAWYKCVCCGAGDENGWGGILFQIKE